MAPRKDHNYQTMTRSELIDMITARCPDVLGVPPRDQWILALHAVNMPCGTIADMAARTQDEIREIVKRWGSTIKDMDDSSKIMVYRHVIFSSLAVCLATCMDSAKMKDQSPRDAIAVAKELPELHQKLVSMEKAMIEADSTREAMDFTSFREQLENRA